MNRVQCIDDSAKPAEISDSFWIKKGEIYTIINSFPDMNGVMLVQLLEIDLVSANTLFKGYAASRFAPIEGINKVVKQYQEVDA